MLRCAIECHSLFRDISRYNNDEWRIELKGSLDYGRVYDANFGLLKAETIHPVGLIVDRCARLNHEAKKNEVVFSSSVFALFDPEAQHKYSKLKIEGTLKGIGKAEYYRLVVENSPKEKVEA